MLKGKKSAAGVQFNFLWRFRFYPLFPCRLSVIFDFHLTRANQAKTLEGFLWRMKHLWLTGFLKETENQPNQSIFLDT